jgi:hypothetical protein
MAIFVVRISSRPGAARTASRDFNTLLNECQVYGSGIWDNDHKNRMKVGDVLLFICGGDCENIHTFTIKCKLSDTKERSRNKWMNTAYSTTAIKKTSHREVIRIKPLGQLSIDWFDMSRIFGYKPTYIPRGCNRVAKPNATMETLLPLIQ